MPVFTDLAVNANNLIRVARWPLEVVCLAVKKLFARTESRRMISLRWFYPPMAPRPTPLPPQEIISCRLEQVGVKECRLRPLAFRRQVIVEVIYGVEISVLYSDGEGNIGRVLLREEIRRSSPPLPGNLFLSAAAGIDLELVDCRVETRNAEG